MISVIIPAHDESAVIDRCLGPMIQGARPGELEVLVVCNGCSDDTPDRARRYGDLVRVIETDVASKSHALNLGDAAATGFPRFYVDADIELPLESIRKVARILETGRVHGAAPRIEVDLRDRGWSIRAYYRVWTVLPYIQRGMMGSGVYAISAEGRRRFERFPDIIADDAFVRHLFQPHERCSVKDAYFRMTPPHTLESLIHINVRRHVGRHEMAERFPEMARGDFSEQKTALLRLMHSPLWWPAIAVYVYARVRTLWRFRRKLRRGRHLEWNRDESSRRPRKEGSVPSDRDAASWRG